MLIEKRSQSNKKRTKRLQNEIHFFVRISDSFLLEIRRWINTDFWFMGEQFTESQLETW